MIRMRTMARANWTGAAECGKRSRKSSTWTQAACLKYKIWCKSLRRAPGTQPQCHAFVFSRKWAQRYAYRSCSRTGRIKLHAPFFIRILLCAAFMSVDAPCHCSCSGGQVEKNLDTCLRLGRRCFSGRWQRPFTPQIVESSTSRGSPLSVQTTPTFPRAMPLGHLFSSVAMSLISSTKLFSTSCATGSMRFLGSSWRWNNYFGILVIR